MKPQDLRSKPQDLVNLSKQADSINFKQTIQINTDLAAQQATTTSALTTEQVKSASGSAGAKYISHQILAEPIRVVSPESIINAAIAAVNVLGQAILNPAKEKIQKLADLSLNPAAVNNYQIYDCVDKASKKCAAIANTQANNAILANGHYINAAFNAAITTGNSIHIVSDTATVNRAPLFSLSSQDTSIQSNNSFSLTSDINYNQFKQDVKFVEGTKISQAQTSLSVATQTADNIAKVNRTVGVEENSSLGKVNKLIADNTLLAASGGEAQVAAYGNLGMQSNGDISILAAKSDAKGDIAASGEENLEKVNSGGSIYFISKPSADFSSMMVMSSKGWLNSTTGDLFTTATGNNISSGGKSNIITSDKYAYFGNPQGGTYTVGGRTFLGKLSFPVLDIEEAQVVDIPMLPVLPDLPTQQLQNCLPNTAKKTFADYNPEGESVLVAGGADDEVFNPNSSDIAISPPSIPAPNNRVQLPKESSTFPNYDPTGEKIFNTKLPMPSVSSATSGLDDGLALINSFTPANILVDKYSTQSKLNIVDLTTYADVFTFNSLLDSLEQEDTLQQLGQYLMSPDDLITNANIKDYIKGIVPEAVEGILQYPQFYIDLFQVSIDKLEKFTLGVTDFAKADRTKVKDILNLINEYPKLKTQVIKLIKDATTIPAIGFLGLISGISSLVTNGLGSVTNAIKVVQSGDVSQIFNLTKPLLSKALNGTVFANLLNNPDLLNIGQTLFTGDQDKLSSLLKSKLDEVYNQKIKTVLEKELGDLLGNYSFLYPAFKDVFNKVRLGQVVNPQEYITEISSILSNLVGGEAVSKASVIYQGVQSLIKDISSGDILSILTGTGTASILGNVLGAESAGTISNIFNVIKQAVGTYEAFKLLPDLINLMNDYNIPAIDQVGIALNCLDLFNKVRNLIDSIGTFTNSTKPAVSLLENAGRLIQAGNTLNYVDDNTLQEWEDTLNQTEDEDEVDLEEYRETFNSNLNLSTCFRMPKLNVFQSAVEIMETRPSAVVFKLTNLDLLKTQVVLLPKINDLLQIRVQGFYSATAREYLLPYQTDFQYTPSVYTFVISQFDMASNIGIAYYDRAYSSIVLENNEGLLYKFNTEAIGSTLNPDVVDAYLLA